MRNARAVAIDALERIDGGAFAHVMLPAQLRGSGLDTRDRAFVTFVVYGSVREQRRPVTEQICAVCPYWEADEIRECP